MKNVYLNHDGGVDDLISLYLLLKMENVRLIGCSVIPADCYLEPALSASRKISDRFGNCETLEIAASTSRGKNPFPKDWRMHAFFVDALPILNEHLPVRTKVAEKPAHLDLIDKLKAQEDKTTLIFIGPLTDLARALEMDPSIVQHIEKLVWMGGTLLPTGNVEEPEHDGTAEWNAFWDPEAMDIVWKSDILIDMVALESTNQVPLTVDIREEWARNRKHEGVDFVGQSYAAVPPLVHFETNSTYYLWDVLTTASVGNSSLVKKKPVQVSVEADGPSQGRTYEDENGKEIQLVYDVDHDAFFSYILSLMKA
ncbi:purine nucleosidase [Terribacillus halophilus]|uniref:Purine nucleosidase n=1 Tax=Terribacillus halophilus TaxID=361279 RepID=A0A1G6HWK6_9BACI|nr:nucleoside hydrolase [Terribacillus halophilus]SDB98689.1 purine nucleosidase [Terribacillus halophilus]